MKTKKKEQHRKVPIWVIVIIFVVIGLLIAGIVCFVLVKTGEAEEYRKARETTEEIIKTRDAVKTYLETETGSATLTEENKDVFNSFEDAVQKVSECMKKLGESRVIENEDVKRKFESAQNELGELQGFGETEQLLMDVLEDGVFDDEEIEQMINANSEYLQNLAKGYKEYRAKIAEFNEKYADLKGKNKTELDADYAKLQQEGNELAKKYESIKLEDVYGMSRDDFLKFYATIEELNNYLTEKN